MKGSRSFIIIFTVLFILYIVAEINKPKPVDWTVTLSKNDKNPYGSFIIYQQLADIFPNTAIQSFRTPVYNQLSRSRQTNTAYFIIGPSIHLSDNDFTKLKKYVSNGNYVIASANIFYQPFLDSFGIKANNKVTLTLKDSSGINFVNPALKSSQNYTFPKATIDQYFSKIDTAKTTVLGINDKDKPVYIKIAYGKGAFFIHADPLCFSNYFLLFKNNASYTSKALSYIPVNVSKIYWNEYYKLGREGATTPLRFFLSNEYLRWALRLAITGLLLYVLFEMKRRQRIIPVIEPLKNTTLDFVKTVAGVYFNEKDNNGIADKKVHHFLAFIRSHYNIATQILNEDFIEQLYRKSGVSREQASDLVHQLSKVQMQNAVTDDMLLSLDKNIDNFYKQV